MGFLEWCGPTTMPPGNGGTTTQQQVLPIPLPVTTGQKTAWTTFDTSNPGSPLEFSLERSDLSNTSITFSTATFGRSADLSFTIGGTATSFLQMMTNPGRYMSDQTTGWIQNEGDDTAYNTDWAAISPVTGVITQFQYEFAVGLNVSAYTAGNFAIGSVDLTLQAFMANNTPAPGSMNVPVRISPSTAFTALTATGTQIMTVRGTIDTYVRTYKGFPITLRLAINETTGTGTRQVGLVPQFPMFAAAGNKMFYESQVIARILPLPQGAQAVTPFTDGWNLTGLEGA